jgi:hypothetical protein
MGIKKWIVAGFTYISGRVLALVISILGLVDQTRLTRILKYLIIRGCFRFNSIQLASHWKLRIPSNKEVSAAHTIHYSRLTL